MMARFSLVKRKSLVAVVVCAIIARARRSHPGKADKTKLIGKRKFKSKNNLDAMCFQNCCKECDALLDKWGRIKADNAKFGYHSHY